MVKRTQWFCLIILQGIEKLFCCIEIVLSQNFLWQILFFCPTHICPALTTLWTQCFGSQSFNMTPSSWHQTSNSLISLLVEYIKIQPGRPTQRWWAIYWFLQATWLLGLNSSGIMSSLNCWCIFSDNVQKKPQISCNQLWIKAVELKYFFVCRWSTLCPACSTCFLLTRYSDGMCMPVKMNQSSKKWFGVIVDDLLCIYSIIPSTWLDWWVGFIKWIGYCF